MLILIRHGRTALNAAGRLQGRLDEPLDPLGEQQALAVAAHVGPVDELVSSPLLRARQTADAFGMPYEIDERWIELAYGVYEGAVLSETPPELLQQWRNPNNVPEGGESLATLYARVREACDEIAERARDRRVVVVSHVSPIKSAVAWTLDAPIDIAWRSYLSPASVCRIDVTRHGPVLTSFNEIADGRMAR